LGEPVESPMPNLLYPTMDGNPAAIRWRRPENPYQAAGDPQFPVVATTFRLTEHHTAGGRRHGASTARLAGAALRGHHIRPNEDDPVAEEPKEAVESADADSIGSSAARNSGGGGTP